MKGKYLFTSESVCEGHPDKIADQISDTVLDSILKNDPYGRVACECLVTTGMALITGEITTKVYVDIPRIARQVIRDIGYTDPSYGFDCESCAILSSIDEQSPDIALGVNKLGAGDQGMMFGYATKETPELMPAPITIAHKICRELSIVRKNGSVPFLRPDGKSQVTMEYVDGKPTRVTDVVVSTQHDPDVTQEQLSEAIIEKVLKPTLPQEFINDFDSVKIYINPTGRFVIGGPHGDSGLTGRKIIVDTYGGVGSHGGGCFSGKDPTKVDRSASYAARWIAKNIVASGLAQTCEIQIAYAIGVPEPISVMINSHGTGKIPDDQLVEIVRKVFDLTPQGMIEALDLRRPIYRRTAVFGHFGRTEEEGFTWELTNRIEELKSAVR
ncbi:MAG: methionine adenosyltransferase [Candidatus Glassbacteria bacterium]